MFPHENCPTCPKRLYVLASVACRKLTAHGSLIITTVVRYVKRGLANFIHVI